MTQEEEGEGEKKRKRGGSTLLEMQREMRKEKEDGGVELYTPPERVQTNVCSLRSLKQSDMKFMQ